MAFCNFKDQDVCTGEKKGPESLSHPSCLRWGAEARGRGLVFLDLSGAWPIDSTALWGPHTDRSLPCSELKQQWCWNWDLAANIWLEQHFYGFIYWQLIWSLSDCRERNRSFFFFFLMYMWFWAICVYAAMDLILQI